MMVNGVRRGGFRLVLSWSFLAIWATAVISGCTGGTDNKPTARVTGKVTYAGQPVPGGSLLFSPIRDAKSNKPGKSGQATIKSDGTYTVTTYTDGDGAVIGSHQLSFSPPAVEQPSAAAGAHVASPPPSPYAGLGSKQAKVAVVKGGNTIDIELVKQAATAAPGTPGAAHGI